MKLYNKIFLVTATIGLVDSLYLVIIKLTNNENLCIKGVGDCWTVNSSVYSQIFGIPIAVIGVIAYSALIGLMFLERKAGFFQENGSNLIFGIALIGVLYSAYLTYLELFVILAICPFCVISAIAMLILFAISIFRLVQSQPESNP